MDGLCPKCGMQLAPTWKFCPACGAAIVPEVPRQAGPMEAAPGEIEHAPMEGPFSGLLFGVLAAPILIIVGTLLCLTGLGAILGVPMILAAILAPLLGPLIGFGALQGKCPWCGSPVRSVTSTKVFHCLACNQGISIKNRRFVRAEE